jgi:thioesterase-3
MGFQSEVFDVRGYHCDSYGHVNHARYFEFMEEARWQMLNRYEIQHFLQESGFQFFIVHIELAYKKPLLPGQQFVIQTSFEEKGRKSMKLSQQFVVNQKEEVYAKGSVTFVLFDPKNQKAVSIEEEYVKLFQAD